MRESLQMGHWYRRPKRLDIRPILSAAGTHFYIEEPCASKRMHVKRLLLSENSNLSVVDAPDGWTLRTLILISLSEASTADLKMRLLDGWRAVIRLPPMQVQWTAALGALLCEQSNYRIAKPYPRDPKTIDSAPFLLDLSVLPFTAHFSVIPKR